MFIPFYIFYNIKHPQKTFLEKTSNPLPDPHWIFSPCESLQNTENNFLLKNWCSERFKQESPKKAFLHELLLHANYFFFRAKYFFFFTFFNYLFSSRQLYLSFPSGLPFQTHLHRMSITFSKQNVSEQLNTKLR